MPYQLPDSAKPFTLSISDTQLSEFTQLLKLSKLGPQTWEGQQPDGRFGVTREWLSDAKDYWLNKFDWRAQEKRINSFDNYTMEIEGRRIHFIGLFSSNSDAAPVVFMHGWPGSFIEFLPMLEKLIEKYGDGEGKGELPFHVVVPSLPGYGLSEGGPLDGDWTMKDSARVIDSLMRELGFGKYVAQGGDVGSFVAHELGVGYEGCVGVHLNMISVRNQPDLSKLDDKDKQLLQNAKQWSQTGIGYALEHGTRPSTISLVLSSNPLALLAWIGEKFLEWSDDSTTPSLDTILTNVSLYWFTESFPTSIYPYRALFGGGRDDMGYIKKPLGFSFFPKELFPGFRDVCEGAGDLVAWKRHERGGHFAALECTEELLGDVVEFVGSVWKV